MHSVHHDYRDAMAYQFYCIVGFIVIPFAVWSFAKGNYIISVPPALTVALCLINVYSFKRHQQLWLPPTIISSLFIVANFLVVYDRGVIGGYWTYPVMLAIYWTHTQKTAAYGVSILFVTSCMAGFFVFPIDGLIRYAATLVMTGIFLNITAGVLEQQYREVEELTVTDHLTGAFNRRFMDHKIDELIERLNRSGTHSSLITLDVDHFKLINDSVGHSGGDQVLQALVQILKSRVRSLDHVCRAGGEEFVIILPATRQQEALLLAEELRHTIAQETLLHDTSVTISCGVSENNTSDTRDAWLKRSDQALYKAKNNGRNKVVVSHIVENSGLIAS